MANDKCTWSEAVVYHAQWTPLLMNTYIFEERLYNWIDFKFCFVVILEEVCQVVM